MTGEVERRETILVVDDHPRNRTLVRSYLEPRYDIVEAGNADEALAAIGGIDLVLLDVMMPGRSGLDACRAIKAGAEGFLPVILLTALSEQTDRNAGLESGADDFLTKPVDRQELLLRVRAFLRLREQDRMIRKQLAELRQLGALKEDLVDLLVHDLRSPLAGMLSLVQFVSRQALDEELKEDLRVALYAGTRLRRTVDDLLKVRQLEEASIPLQRERIDLSTLALSTLGPLEGAAREKSVRLELTAPEPVIVAVDRDLVERAIENLVANALKYGPSGSRVEVEVRGEDEQAVITVSDEGPGVPDAAREGIFRKFGAIEMRRADVRRGHGLGLYLVRLVATAHGGRVTVASRSGGGAVFRVELPGRHA